MEQNERYYPTRRLVLTLPVDVNNRLWRQASREYRSAKLEAIRLIDLGTKDTPTAPLEVREVEDWR